MTAGVLALKEDRIAPPPGLAGYRGAKVGNYGTSLAAFLASLTPYEAALSNSASPVEVYESLEYFDTGTWSGWDGNFDTITGRMQAQLATRPLAKFRLGIPMVTSQSDWDNMLAGSLDSHFTHVNDRIVSLNNSTPGIAAKFALRIGWEMNGDWYAWGRRPSVYFPGSTWTTAKYRAGWRRIAGLLAGCRALGTRTIWNPAVPLKNEVWSHFWPGYDDNMVEQAAHVALVDVVGFDCYDQWNGGSTAAPETRWSNLYDASDGIHSLLNFRAAHGNKPMSVDEWGDPKAATSVNAGPDPYFIARMIEVLQGLLVINKLDGQCYWETSASLDCRLNQAGMEEPWAVFKATFGE